MMIFFLLFNPSLNDGLDIRIDRGIQLTGLACVHGRARAQAPCGRALPEVHWGVPVLVRDRCRLPGLPGLAAVAWRLRLPEVRAWRLGRGRWPVQVRGLRQADFGDGGHAVRPQADAADGVVHRLLDVRYG